MSTSFLASNNANIMFMDYDTGNLAIGAYNPAAKFDIAGDTIMRSNVKTLGVVSLCNDVHVAGAFTASNNVTFASNVNIQGLLTVSNVTYITSNVIIFSSETVQSNLTVTSNLFVNGTVSFSNTLGVSNNATFDSNVYITGTTIATGSATFSNPVALLSNLTTNGPVSLSNTLGVSNVATFGSNVFVSGASVTSGNATFSNTITMTSNGSVVFNTSNNQLGINLGGSNPRADLDISTGNFMAKNFHRLGKSADTSNPISITINWDNSYNSANLYFILADISQSIANGNEVGFRTQRVAIGVSNYNVTWTQAAQVFGCSNAYLTLNFQVSASNNNSVTLQSTTSWNATGNYAHGFNVDIVHIPASSNIGKVYLT